MIPEQTLFRRQLNHIDAGLSIDINKMQGCPSMYTPLYNAGELSRIACKCNDLGAAILALRLKFKSANTKLKSKNGHPVITMTRKDIANIYGWSTDKVDRLIKKLPETGIVNVYKDKYKGVEQHFFEFASNNILPFPVHFSALDALTEEIGTLKEAVAYSYIIYRLRNSQITHNEKLYCTFTTQELASFLQVSERTALTILNSLRKKDIIQTDNFLHNNKRQLHIALGCLDVQSCLDTHLVNKYNAKHLENQSKVIHTPHRKKHQGGTAKNAYPIYNVNKIKSTKNNITDIRSKNDLSYLQKIYAQAALRKTLCTRQAHLFGNYWPEVEFYLTEPKQHPGATSFRHALNIAMALIRQNRWRTPYGFNRYSQHGQKSTKYQTAMLAEHQRLKQLECHGRIAVQ